MTTPMLRAVAAGSPDQIDAPNRPTNKLFGIAVHSLIVRAVGPASSIFLTLFLARELGAEDMGIFFVVLTLVTACAIISKFGLDTALQRFVGAARGVGDLPLVLGLYRWSVGISSILAVTMTFVCIGFAGAIADLFLGDTKYTELIHVLALVIGPFTVLGVHAAMLKAVGKPAWGGFIEAAAWPVCTISLLIISTAYVPMTMHSIAIVYTLAAVLAAVWGFTVLKRSLPNRIGASRLGNRQLVASCLPLTGVDLINYLLLWTPFMLLPALANASEAGLYNVSHRLAAQLGLLMIVFTSITLPRFAAHAHLGDHPALASLAGRSIRTMLMFALPPTIILLVWSDVVLGIFGGDFIDAAGVLHILVLGQLFNLATGPVGYLLAMTGHERLLRNTLLVTAVMTLLLSLLLIPRYGAVGAAWSATLPLILHNLVCCLLTAKHLKLPFFLLLAR